MSEAAGSMQSRASSSLVARPRCALASRGRTTYRKREREPAVMHHAGGQSHPLLHGHMTKAHHSGLLHATTGYYAPSCRAIDAGEHRRHGGSGRWYWSGVCGICSTCRHVDHMDPPL